MPRSAPPVQKISQRLHVTQDLAARQQLILADKKAHYLRNVLRLLEAGAQILFFNGRDGEWLGRINDIGKKQVSIELIEQTRTQDAGSDIWLLVAPVKKDRLDYLAQKATEMGVGRLMPVMTARAQGGKAVKHEKLVANSIEAAEQCEILTVPEISEVTNLADILADWPQDRTLIFCDEEAQAGQGLAALDTLKGKKLAVLIGPEGGFDAAERAMLNASRRYPCPLAGATHFAHRYGGGGGAGSHSSAAWRLAKINAKPCANLFLAANDPK